MSAAATPLDPASTMQRPTTTATRRHLFEEALALMEARLAEPRLVLDDLTAALFTSRRQLQRVFTDQGTSFRTELVRLRMERAATLLHTAPHASVRQVALTVGYLQPAQFAKAFRRVHGVSPREHRARRTVHGDERHDTARAVDGLSGVGGDPADRRP